MLEVKVGSPRQKKNAIPLMYRNPYSLDGKHSKALRGRALCSKKIKIGWEAKVPQVPLGLFIIAGVQNTEHSGCRKALAPKQLRGKYT
jgi:hypothetical protein